MNGFNGVKFTDKIGVSPAAVHLRSGVLHINPEVFFSYPREWQKFIVLHEMGHWKLQTRSEEKADEYAFHHFVNSGESLKDAVASLLRVLDTEEPAHRKRIEAALKKAKFWDSEIYQNQSKTPKERKEAMSDYIKQENEGLVYCLGQNDIAGAKDHMVNILMVVDPAVQSKLESKFATLIADVSLQKYDGNYLDDMAFFFCFGNKACQDRAKLKAQAKAELIKSKGLAKQSRAEAKVIRAQATQTRADAKKSLADLGIKDSAVGDITKSITDLGKTAASVFSGGKIGTATEEQTKSLVTGMPDPAANEAEQPKSNKGLIIGVSITLVLIIIAVVAFLMLRKKS